MPEGLRDAQVTAQRAAVFAESETDGLFRLLDRPHRPAACRWIGLLKGIERAVSEKGRTPAHGKKAADAILTSDTRPKTVTVTFTYDGKKHTVAGIAKGAGMIQPNMATMLAFLATDFSVPRSFLQKTLSEAVTGTFNCITVDGDMSTNDTVLMLANGHSGVSVGDKSPRELRVLVCRGGLESLRSAGRENRLRRREDHQGRRGEGRRRGLRRGRGESGARHRQFPAREIVLVWRGPELGPPGRMPPATPGAKLVETKLDILYNDTPAMTAGKPHPELKPKWKEIVKARRFTVTLNLHLGKAAVPAARDRSDRGLRELQQERVIAGRDRVAASPSDRMGAMNVACRRLSLRQRIRPVPRIGFASENFLH